MTKTSIHNIYNECDKLVFHKNRTPYTGSEENSYKFIEEYRDSHIYVIYYSGKTEWEKHPDDELVTVLDGETTLTVIENNGHEKEYQLSAGDMAVIKKNNWHRFLTPDAVKIFSITPQPTEHSPELPI